MHACKVVLVGKIFLRRMIDIAHSVRHQHYQIGLNIEFRSDLEWWVQFLEKWNGRNMMEVHNPQWDPDIVCGLYGTITGCSVYGIVSGQTRA